VTSRRSRQAPAKKGDARPLKAVAEAPASDAQGYVALIAELKQRIADTRLRTALSVNRELVLLYWGIGRDIRFAVKFRDRRCSLWSFQGRA
jgi:hypothetical protein